MMDIQKAIEYFYRQMELGKIENDHQQEVFETAISALEKQTPKKPFINDYSLTCCPNCHGIEVLAGCESIELNYCNQCGQKLDWEGESE